LRSASGSLSLPFITRQAGSARDSTAGWSLPSRQSASRWLQHLPPEERPACGPALDYLLSAFGPVEGLGRVLRGSGECGAVDWTLLSFSIPEWTLAAFMALSVWAVFLAWQD
jgi:disulfide bond formation protein DsbB